MTNDIRMQGRWMQRRWMWRCWLVVVVGLTACSKSADDVGETMAGPVEEAAATPLPEVLPVSSEADLGPLFQAMAGRRFVLLGESTHGTHEYYAWRGRLSRRLVREKGFRFVAVEGDWESISRLNEYIQGRTPPDMELRTLLRGLDRWPQWMWANEDFAGFLERLREKNTARPANERIGIYGLDMQDPQASMSAVVDWVGRHLPDREDWVRSRYAPLHGMPDGFRQYARHLSQGGDRLSGQFAEVADWLESLQIETPDDPALFAAMMNALAVVSAEGQHAAMVRGGPDSWNVRARFMHTAFERLAQRYGEGSRGIVWAHNTHVGDASATEMQQRGEVNIGQLLRQAHGADDVYILGFSTAGGTVVAGAEWGAPMQVMAIAPPRPDSLEAALMAKGLEQAILFFDADRETQDWNEPLTHRAIGVVYRPPHEAYVMTIPAQRYDALFFIRETRALTPVD